MKIKKGFKEVKEMLSPHHHDHHSPDGHSEHRRRLLRRKSGPNDSRRGPLAPVLDHLEKSNSVPIHLHISPSGDFSISRNALLEPSMNWIGPGGCRCRDEQRLDPAQAQAQVRRKRSR